MDGFTFRNDDLQCSRCPSDQGQLRPPILSGLCRLEPCQHFHGEGNTAQEIAPKVVIMQPCWDCGLALGWDRLGCRVGAAAGGTLAALDGSVTQVQPGFLSSRFGNKDKACHACD